MKTIFLITTLLLAMSANSALAADKAKPAHKMPMMELTPAQREEMATVHEKMAACLRSDKPIEDCHKEMMKSCKMGKACPMMGKMHGMKHRHEEMEDEQPGKEEAK